MPGSDCPACGTIPGRSLLREVEMFFASGIPAGDALRFATIGSAEFLGIQDRIGTVEVGKIADLVLLNADPIADIGVLRRQSGVMAAGTWLSAEALRAQVAAFDGAVAPVPA
jgi:imidazolonepropionase-like amidohydrolase